MPVRHLHLEPHVNLLSVNGRPSQGFGDQCLPDQNSFIFGLAKGEFRESRIFDFSGFFWHVRYT